MLSIPRKVTSYLKSVCGHWKGFDANDAIKNGKIKVREKSGSIRPLWLPFDGHKERALIFPGENLVYRGKDLALPSENMVALWKPIEVSSEMSGGVDDFKYFGDLSREVSKEQFFTPIGRLDVQTSGLLLLSTAINSGLKEIIKSEKIQKTYVATVRKDLSSEELKRRLETLSSDIKLREGIVRAEGVDLLKHDAGEAEIEIRIRCGWNRVVRRMLKISGLKCRTLHRTKIGSIGLRGLLFSEEYRTLNLNEVESLWSSYPGGKTQWLNEQIEALRNRAEKTDDSRLQDWLKQYDVRSKLSCD